MITFSDVMQLIWDIGFNDPAKLVVWELFESWDGDDNIL